MAVNRQTVLITGAAGHLGTAVCRKYLKEGFSVIATARPGEERHGESVDWVELDLRDYEACNALVEELSTKSNGLETAVFCAGGFAMHGIRSVSMSDVQKMIALNFETAFHLAGALFNLWIEHRIKGRLVFIGGKPGLHPELSTAMVSYGLSKGLVASYASMLDEAGKGRDIRSFTIVPGTIDTETNRLAMPDADRSAWVTPAALAEHIFWLTNNADNNFSTNVFEFYGH